MLWKRSVLLLALLALTALGASAITARRGSLPQAAHVEIPLRAENDWFIVPVVVNGTDSLRFILDTGASVSAVTVSTMARLGLDEGDPVVAYGASGAQRMRTTSVPSLALGNLHSSRVQALILDDATLTPEGGREAGYPAYDGVLGVDILELFDVLMDPVAGVLHLYRSGEIPAPEVLADLAEPLSLRTVAGRIIGHDVEVDGVTLPAVFDTGSRRVVLNRAAARAAGVEPEPDAARSVERPGVGSESFEVQASRVESLDLGDTSLGAMPITVGDLPVFRVTGFGGGPAVLLGSPAVRRCPVFLSYRNREVRYCRTPAA